MFKLFRFLRPYAWQCVVLVASIGFQAYCTLQLPAYMADIVNNGIVKGDVNYTWLTGLKMLGYTILAALGALSAHFFSSRIGAAFSRDLRASFYQKILSFSLSDIDNFSTASLITRTTNDIGQVQQATMMMLTMMLRAPLMGIGAIYQAFVTAPSMTWTLALALGSIVFFTIIILSLVMPKFKLFQKLVDKLTLLARENLTGLRVIRAFNNEKKEHQKFERANEELMRTNIFIDKILSLQDPLIGIVFNGITLLVVWLGLKGLQTDLSYLGNMMAFVQYATQVIMSFLVLTMLFVVLPRASVSAKRINEVFAVKPKIHWLSSTSGTPSVAPSVEFKNVSFAYTGAEQNVLTNVSFLAKAGETTAFIGSTGSGKSTLLSLVPRFYEATSGTILINGLNIKNYAKDDLMRRIGYVPQKGVLFSGDVATNLSFGNPSATTKELARAAKIAEASDFISKLPNSYHTHIAQGGTNVSGGQKQRLSIARAIAKKPEIYIFDDSFSALDMKTDQRLRQNLNSETQDSVVLVVAQRISTIKDANQIVVLDSGKVVGSGTHSQLLKSCEVYQQIVKSQLSESEYQKELKHAA